MTSKKSEREARHLGILANISRLRCAEGELRAAIVRAKMTADAVRSYAATERGAEAFERLLHMAEQGGDQSRRIARFVGFVWGAPVKWEAVDLCGMDAAIGNDMLAVFDAIRHTRVGAEELAEDVCRRVPAMLQDWALMPADVPS